MSPARRCNGTNNSSLTRIVTVWDPAYVTDAAPTISTTKAARVIELAQAEDLVELRQAPFDDDAAWADIATVHDQAYVEAVRTGEPRRLAESQGFRWSPAFAACRRPHLERPYLRLPPRASPRASSSTR